MNQTHSTGTFFNYFINSTSELFMNKDGDLLIYYIFEYGK